MNEKKINQSFSLEGFVPSWPSSVMGTAILPIAFYLGKSIFPFFSTVAIILTGFSFLLMCVVTVIWLLKFVRHNSRFIEELHHPVLGSFVPTFPISFMILAIDMLLIGTTVINPQIATLIAMIFFWIGTLGIYLLSWIIMPSLFQSTIVEKEQGTFGWYIPPVSHLIVPVVGLDLVHHLNGAAGSNVYFFISLISLGIGFFIFIGPNVFYRYIYKSSPTGKMAPTLLIGLAPTSILVIILAKLNNAFQIPGGLFEISSITGFAQVMGLVFWGFSFWWLILSSVKIVYLLRKRLLKFTLSWWAFTFPIGAFSVATGALNSTLKSAFFSYTQVVITLLLFVIWIFVSIKTIRGISDRTIFSE